MWRSIMVLTDLSDNSAIFLKRACELAKNFSAKLYVLHVVQYRKINYNYAIAFPTKKIAYDLLEKNARSDIEAILPEKKDNITVVIERGDPKEMILESVKRIGVDLIIMDGSRHSFLRHLERGRCQCLINHV